jgi:hypothetical protein
MALPSSSDLDSMDYAFQAQPYVSVPTKCNLSLKSMDFAFQAQPFVTNDYLIPTLTAVQHLTHIDLTWTE